MLFFNVSYQNEKGEKTVEEFYTETEAKECMKKHPGSKGMIIHQASTDWEPVGEFTAE